MQAGKYFIAAEETLDRPALGALQRQKFAAMMREVVAGNVFYRKKFAGLNVADFESRSLSNRKELEADQVASPPEGTKQTYNGAGDEVARYPGELGLV
jgi:hypothetical protein